FAFIKATEGRDLRDPHFSTHWRESAASGIRRGAYHFFTFCSPGVAQAANFIDVVPKDDDALPPAVDVEFVGNCTRWQSIDGIRAELALYLASVEAYYDRKPILYLTEDAHGTILTSAFQGYPIWIRTLTSTPDLKLKEWTFWQHDDDGRVPGIDGPVD